MTNLLRQTLKQVPLSGQSSQALHLVKVVHTAEAHHQAPHLHQWVLRGSQVDLSRPRRHYHPHEEGKFQKDQYRHMSCGKLEALQDIQYLSPFSRAFL